MFETSEKNVLGRLIEDKVEKNGDKPFLYFEDQTITYGQMNEITNRIANGFIRMGVKKGDKVAIMMENCPEYIYTWFALSKIGAIEIPINSFQKGDILKYVINYSDSKLIVVSESLIEQVKEIEKGLENIEKAICHEHPGGSVFKSFVTEPYLSLLDNPISLPKMDVSFNDLLAIMFTSGTTGPSKGAMITHNQAIFVASQYADFLKFTDQDIGYLYLPLFHVAPQFALLIAPMLLSGSVILKKGFSARSFWDDIRRHSCTISGAFEAVLRILSKAPEKDDDAQNPLRVLATGYVPPDVHERFEKRFGVRLVSIYGMTEGDAIICATCNDIRFGSCGKPRNFFDVKIVDPKDKELPVKEVGEIVIRPRQPHIIFEGYYKKPGKTLKTFRNLWFLTGDLAYKDEEGYFFFVGREKDMIRRGGENISALEVETVVEEHPKVKECAAMAAPSDIWGEEVKVVIVPKEGAEIDPEEIITYCDEKMAYFMVPRFVEFTESIPRTGASQRPIKDLLKRITPTTWDRVKAGVKLKREIEKDRSP